MSLTFVDRVASHRPDVPPAFAADLANTPCDILILAVPGCSALSLVALVETFRHANALLGRQHFRWSLVAHRDDRAVSAPGIDVFPIGGLFSMQEARRDIRRYRYTFVFADGPTRDRVLDFFAPIIRLAQRSGSILVEIGSGAFVLPRLGLLDQEPYTVHPVHRSAFSEQFPFIPISDDLFCVGGKFISCCGEAATFELALFLVDQQNGLYIAKRIRSRLLLARGGEGLGGYRLPSSAPGCVPNNHVRNAMEIMGNSIDAAISLTDIYRFCKVSERQMQRLFIRYTGKTCRKYFLDLKLERAYQLLEQTEMSIIDVATACGFSSGSYFSQSMKERWGLSPSAIRRRAQSRLIDGVHR